MAYLPPEEKRGCCKNCFITCASYLCLIPMAWISFTVFDLGSAITGGLFTNMGSALNDVFKLVPELSTIPGLGVIAGGFVGVMLITVFPLHWMLQFRPDEPIFTIALIIPWILTVFISALIWSKDAKDGAKFSLRVGLPWMIGGIIISIGLNALLDSEFPGGSAIINGVFTGLTGTPLAVSIFLACLEGIFVGAIFGALAGAIRYDPKKQYAPKNYDAMSVGSNGAFGQSSYSSENNSAYSPTSAYSSPSSKETTFCTNCGSSVESGIDFCTNCGHKVE